MTAPTPLRLLAELKAHQESKVQPPSHPLDLTPSMLESLAKLAGVSLRRDELSSITQFQDWWQGTLQKLAEMGREIYFFSKAEEATTSHPAWLHLGLSLCQLFLDYVEQLPSTIQQLLSDIESRHVQLTDHLETIQSEKAGPRLIKLLEGFTAIAGLQAAQDPATELPPSLSLEKKPGKQLKQLLEKASFAQLLIDVQELKPIVQNIKGIDGINKMIEGMKRFIEKRLHGAWPKSPESLSETGENPSTSTPTFTSSVDPMKNFPIFFVTLDFSYRSAKMISAYIKEMTDVVIMLTYYSDILGRITGTLFQQYQTVWYEHIQAGGDWQKKSVALDMMESIYDEPELMEALTGSSTPKDDTSHWVKAEKLNQFIQEKRRHFNTILTELSQNWDEETVTQVLESLKDDLAKVPAVVNSQWVQTAWEDIVNLQDQTLTLSDALHELTTSLEAMG